MQTAISDPRQKACFLTATTRHSGNWLTALPIASSGLRLDDEAIRVTDALWLGLDLCVPHVCRCGSQADAWGLHGFESKQVDSRGIRLLTTLSLDFLFSRYSSNERIIQPFSYRQQVSGRPHSCPMGGGMGTCGMGCDSRDDAGRAMY